MHPTTLPPLFRMALVLLLVLLAAVAPLGALADGKHI